MGLLRGIGNSFGRIVGTDSIRAGGELVRGLGKQALSQSCPACTKGHLTTQTVEIDGQSKEMKACDACDYTQPLAGPTEAEYEVLRERLDERMADFNEEDIRRLMKEQQFSFRIYLALSVVAFLYAAYDIVAAMRAIVFFPALGFSALFLTLAMKSSYRYWQLRTRTFFQPGSFNTWWKSGEWIV